MPQKKLRLKEAIDLLRAAYGSPPPPPTRDPWEALLRLNASYLVDDERRDQTYRALKRSIGTAPRSLLKAEVPKLEQVIAGGGMKPELRAAKLRECAHLALEVDLPSLTRELRGKCTDESLALARKALKRFPGIGEPGADELLLLSGCARTLAPESNALRVLVRLGFLAEQ